MLDQSQISNAMKPKSNEPVGHPAAAPQPDVSISQHTVFLATECSQEEREVISKLFNDVRRTFSAIQKVKQREHDNSLLKQQKSNSNSANAEAIVSVRMDPSGEECLHSTQK